MPSFAPSLTHYCNRAGSGRELYRRVIAPLAAEQSSLRAREVASSRVDFFTLVRGDNL
nr:phosphonate C-P lyase system protein PhnG [Sodalis glossinidius]